MKWILILAVPWGSIMGVEGMTATTATFDDKPACEAALASAKKFKRMHVRSEIDGLCVPSASEATPQKER